MNRLSTDHTAEAICISFSWWKKMSTKYTWTINFHQWVKFVCKVTIGKKRRVCRHAQCLRINQNVSKMFVYMAHAFIPYSVLCVNSISEVLVETAILFANIHNSRLHGGSSCLKCESMLRAYFPYLIALQPELLHS